MTNIRRLLYAALLIVAFPALTWAQLRPLAGTTLTTTDTSADSVHVGCAVGSSGCTGGIKAGTATLGNAETALVTGPVSIPSAIPVTTSLKLYNNGSTLFWNGIALATGGSISGTTNKIGKFTSASSIGNSNITDDGTTVTVAGTHAVLPDLTIGGVGIVSSAGQIPAISSTYFASLSGASLTGIPTSAVSSGNFVATLSGGTGISVASGSGNASAPAVSLTNTAVTASSYGSSTAVPSFTVDAQGRLTAAGTAIVIATAATASTVMARDASGDANVHAFVASTTIDASGTISIDANNVYFQARTSASTPRGLIGINASDKISIDPSGLGTVFGGDIGATGSRVSKVWATDATITNAISGSVTGNAGTATALQTARTINGVSFNGTANITIASTAPNALTIGTHLTGTSYDGSAPITIATDAVSTNTASTIVARDASGNFSAGTVSAALTGNASTATALATGRAINGVTFDGTAAITVTAAAGTLSGGTLASSVTASSLTSVGTLTGGATGAGFTVALSTSTITGTLADARLSANVPLLNAANIFTSASGNVFGSGGTGAADTLVAINGSSATSHGGYLVFRSNGTDTNYIGSHSVLFGGTSQALTFRATTSDGIEINATDAAGDVRIYSRNTLAVTFGASQLATFIAGVSVGGDLTIASRGTTPTGIGSAPTLTAYRGNGTTALTDPNQWITITVNGVRYNVPGYTCTLGC